MYTLRDRLYKFYRDANIIAFKISLNIKIVSKEKISLNEKMQFL
jgi:hypothetical protein